MFDPLDDDQSGWARLAFVLIPALVLLTLLALAINNSGDDQAGDIEGTQWSLDELSTDGILGPVISGSSVSLLLDEGQAGGSGGCNSFGGDYELDAESLRFGPVASTLRFCDDPPGLSEQESAYFRLLSEVESYALVDSQLVLSSADGVVLVFDAT